MKIYHNRHRDKTHSVFVSIKRKKFAASGSTKGEAERALAEDLEDMVYEINQVLQRLNIKKMALGHE